MPTDEWAIELVEDRGQRGAREPGFIRGPRFVLRRTGATDDAAVIELMLGTVYVPAVREALGPRAESDDLLDLLDEVGADIVRHDLPHLELELPPNVTRLYVDGEGVHRLVEQASNRG